MEAATDRGPLGLQDRGRVRVVAATFDPSPNSYLGLEPAYARLGDPDRICFSVEEEEK